MKKIIDLIDPTLHSLVKKMAFPSWLPPMLATLTHEYFSNPDWLFERKFDGERLITYKNGSRVSLMTRNEKSASATYPEIVEALRSIGPDKVILDGELVAFAGKETSFSKLQERIHLSDYQKISNSRVKVYYYIFDILYVDGYDVRTLPLYARKQLMKSLLQIKSPLRRTTHRNTHGVELRKAACKAGWEGLIAKDRMGTYEGKRSTSWLKFKCFDEQELVIVGYTDPEGGRDGFGALLVGYYEKGILHYAGKVGTGYNEVMLAMLYAKMKPLEVATSPVVNFSGSSRGIHWIKPKLVGEFRFHSWTNDNKLRHASYLGLRDDKSAKDVVKE